MHTSPDFPISAPVMILWIVLLVALVAGFIQLLIHLNRKGKRNALGLIFVLLLAAGTAIHVVLLSRSSHTVTDGNWIQLVMVSMLTALEMFIGNIVVFDDIIAAVIFREPLLLMIYVSIFSLVLSYTLSMVLLIMPRRLKDRTWLSFNQFKAKRKQKNHIFLDINPRSKVLAKTILGNKSAENKGEVILVDFPSSDKQHKELSIGELFTNIFGRQKSLSLEDELGSDDFVLLRGHLPENEDKDLCSAIGLKQLQKWLENPGTAVYILSADENENFSLLKYLVSDQSVKAKVFCYTERVNSYTSLMAAMGDRVRLLNPPELSFMELKQNSPELHPVHFANVATDASGNSLGYIKSPASAMLIGFGESGQEGLRYLWEYGSFVGKDGSPVQNTYYVYDPNIESLKGDFLSRTPALRYGADINWSSVSTGSSQFWLEFAMMLPTLNYVIISTGKSHVNVEIAVRLLQEASRYGKDLSKLCILVLTPDADKHMLETIDFYNRSYSPEGSSVIHPFGLPDRIWNLDVVSGRNLKPKSNLLRNLLNMETWEQRSKRIRGRGGNVLLNRQELQRKQAEDINHSLFAHTLRQLCPPEKQKLVHSIPDTFDPDKPVHFEGNSADAALMEHLAKGEHLHFITALQAAGYIDGGTEQDELNKKIKNLRTYEHITDEKDHHISWLAVKAAILEGSPQDIDEKTSKD